ncbi:MAG: GAF domain-containing protein [Chloroflexi bacterium]|nr:GAF domain-containing protein [Chloroflexota bacterium]
MSDPTNLIIVGVCTGYFALIAILAGRSRDRFPIGLRRWMVLTLVAALLHALSLLVPEDAHLRGAGADLFIGHLTPAALSVLLGNLTIVFFTRQALRFLRVSGGRAWYFIGLIWWAVLAGASVLLPDLALGQDGWLGTIGQPDQWPGLVVVAGWIAMLSVLSPIAFIVFYRAPLPEVANRALFWAFVIPLVMLGVMVSSSGTLELAEVGWLMQFAGLLAASYSVWAYRVVELRLLVRWLAVGTVLALMTAAVFFGGLLIADELVTGGGARRRALLAGLAIAGALVAVPLYLLTERLVRRVIGESAQAVAQDLRHFSERVTSVVDLDVLIEITEQTLKRVLRVRRGGLMLVSAGQAGEFFLEPVFDEPGEPRMRRGRIDAASPIATQFARWRLPLLQYDLDFAREYRTISEEEREFFRQMRMSAYAPVIVQGRLIGVLCAGPKASDASFATPDLDLLLAMANQVGVALRNARLVADLRRRESEQGELNRQLSSTKEQLERLDGVKTDFVTIASHELRTPLAQLRGYNDIMEAMNEDGLLDQEQIASMTGSVRRAADRLEQLIEAMLDVSQLDVDAMDLHFAPVSADSILRNAIEPLRESIDNRKLLVTARGLSSLPPLQGDLQRLVQAFRNVVLNAIKYTPDGGRIEITGRLQDDEILVAVRDSGIGIDPQYHELIFQKFFRTHDPNLHSSGTTKFMGAGPGLGLTIARGVIEGHGGRIWVESKGEDRATLPGSVFNIALPLRPPADARRVVAIDRARQAFEQRRRTKPLDAVQASES